MENLNNTFLTPDSGSPTARRSRSTLAIVDLGRIDLMVQDGFYSNRTDFIRTAIRNQLDRHADVVTGGDPKGARPRAAPFQPRGSGGRAGRGAMLEIKVLGLASIASDVTPELARAAIASVTVLGALHAIPRSPRRIGRSAALSERKAKSMNKILPPEKCSKPPG